MKPWLGCRFSHRALTVTSISAKSAIPPPAKEISSPNSPDGRFLIGLLDIDEGSELDLGNGSQFRRLLPARADGEAL